MVVGFQGLREPGPKYFEQGPGFSAAVFGICGSSTGDNLSTFGRREA